MEACVWTGSLGREFTASLTAVSSSPEQIDDSAYTGKIDYVPIRRKGYVRVAGFHTRA